LNALEDRLPVKVKIGTVNCSSHDGHGQILTESHVPFPGGGDLQCRAGHIKKSKEAAQERRVQLRSGFTAFLQEFDGSEAKRRSAH